MNKTQDLLNDFNKIAKENPKIVTDVLLETALELEGIQEIRCTLLKSICYMLICIVQNIKQGYILKIVKEQDCETNSSNTEIP